MNSEWRAAWALIIFSATLTIAIVLAIGHSSKFAIGGVVAFGLAVTLVWTAGPALLRLLNDRRH